MKKKIFIASDGVNADLEGVVEFLNDASQHHEFEVPNEDIIISDEIITKNTYERLSVNLDCDLLIIFTDKQYYNNYFFETNGSVYIVSFYGWNYLTKLSRNNGIAYFVADILSLGIDSSFRHTLDDSSKPECIYDFKVDKASVDASMRASYICRECNARIKDKLINNDQLGEFNDIKNILNELGSASKWDEDVVKFWGDRVASNLGKQEKHKSKIFISYSHADSEWLHRVKVHLKPLERESIIEIWEDTRIQTGDSWKQEIEKALERSGAAILLVSADFLASDFIVENELPQLLKAAEEEGTRIFQLIVSPCCFDESDYLSQFQAVNSPSSTLIELGRGEQERLLLDLAKSIISHVKNG